VSPTANTNSSRKWLAIDHVQLAMPPGGEPSARRFFVDLLGFAEVLKPAPLAVRGGCWFESGPVRVHLGVEHGFRPARKAHPALVVGDLVGFIAATGIEARWSDEVPGSVRCHIDDPFGNRIELIDGVVDELIDDVIDAHSDDSQRRGSSD
jgi:catechol 2,3-dioxygenase-like lactoylglutathione lyase family enzyme